MPSRKIPDAQSRNLANYKHPDKFGKWLGYEVTHVDLDHHKVEVQLKIREDHLSPAGRMHGGVISALFDFTCGAAVFTTLNEHDFCSTVELKVNYLRPVELGDLLIAKAEVIFRGKRLSVCHGYAYVNSRPDPVAMVTATFNVGSRKVGSEAKSD